ncbi:MAG: ABC transporter permease [Firmicutes bacterium HGW-Firmicutes-16]|nr:MAG: ABC transporter permease [Firmicutes bacterium HGW-Firmicutes-16]
MKAFGTHFKTELKLSLRGMDMVIFAICMPIVVMVILGIIYGSKPAFDGASYSFLEQSFGAVAAIAVCAGGVMGLPLVVSDYRNKKILKRFKVTPVSPTMILLVQVAIYTLYAVVSLLLVYITVRLFFGSSFGGSWLQFLGAYLLVMLSMFSIGMLVGGVSKDVKTAQLLCCVLYFPMLIFSGTTLPYEVMPKALQKVADFMPLTQGIKLLKVTSLGLSTDGVLLPIIVMAALAVLCIGVSIRFFRWE